MRFSSANAVRFFVLASFVGTLVLPGCRSRRPEPAAVDWSADWSEPSGPVKQAAKPKRKRKRDRDDDPGRDRLNDLWRQGYGFNNPNAERLKNGEPTEPFFDDRADDRKLKYRPPDPQYDPLYNEYLRGLSGYPR